MFGEVSKAVVRATGGEQVPWSNSSLGRFYLVSGTPSLPPRDSAASAAEGTAPPSPEVADKAAEIVLPGGITLADWALLAEDRLKAGDHARLLEEAGAHLREHGRVRSVEAVRDRAVSGLVEDVRVETWEDAPPALERIARLEAAAGPRPEFLRLKARAQGLLGDYAAEEAARLQWLRSVPQTHPDRRGMLSALAGARANREASRRFSELLGRPFSPERREGSVGWTDLHYAALLDLPGAVAALCDAGMAADARLKTGSQPFGVDLERALAALGHESFEGRRANGETPLMVASLANARGAAAGLADCGADVGAADGGGLTPLHHAARGNAPEAAGLLVDLGADVGAADGGGLTPLHHAARGNAPEAAGLLVDLGADVGAADGGGLTPLHHAARGNAPEAAGLLVDLGADVNAADGGGLTPLHHAARGNAPEAAGLLVDLGADVNAADGDGWTPLSLALRDEGHHEVQAALRSRGGKATSPEDVERGLGLGVEERPSDPDGAGVDRARPGSGRRGVRASDAGGAAGVAGIERLGRDRAPDAGAVGGPGGSGARGGGAFAGGSGARAQEARGGGAFAGGSGARGGGAFAGGSGARAQEARRGGGAFAGGSGPQALFGTARSPLLAEAEERLRPLDRPALRGGAGPPRGGLGPVPCGHGRGHEAVERRRGALLRARQTEPRRRLGRLVQFGR